MKKKASVILIVVGIVIGWLSLGGTQILLATTSTTEFCISCHSMDTPYAEYQSSIHFSNAKGIRAECSDCHIPKNTVDYLITKIKASKDIYHEFVSGKIDTEEKFEAHRAEMAQTVWDQLEANDSATCRSCHNNDAFDVYEQSQSAQKMHQYAAENNQTCINCHKGIAHFLPDDSAKNQELSRQALAKLFEEAKSTPINAMTTYPIETITMGDLGTINPATPLTFISQQDSKRTVTVNGYQMQGAEKIIYAAEGKRTVIAILSDAGQAALKVGDFKEDNYGNQWRKVSLQATIDAPVLAKLDSLWRHAEQLDTAYCSTCHAKIASDHFTVNAWPSIAKSMGERTSISAEDLEILTKYFQYHAKDAISPAENH